MQANTDEGLKRVIGVSGLALTIVNFTVGAGIFVLPAVIGIQLGLYSIIAYLICALMLSAIMLCYAEVGSRITNSGGSYAYVETAFGPAAGFIINCIFLLGWSVLSDAALMNVIADSLAVLFPVFLNSFVRAGLFAVLLGGIVYINIRGVSQGVGFIKLVTVVKLVPLLLIILLGFFHIKGDNLRWENLPAVNKFGSTAFVLFYAFAGFESALNISGEIKDPKRTIPRAIMLGGSIVLIIYLVLQLVILGVIGDNLVQYKEAPLAAVAERIVGKTGGTILLFAAAFSCFTNVSGDVLATPRVLFAGAKDGLFPKILAKVHPRFATPYVAIIIFAIAIFVAALAGGFEQLAVFASAAILIIYLSVMLATIKLRKKIDKDSFIVPGGNIIPVIGIAAIAWLFTSLSRKEIFTMVIFIVVISVIYIIMQLISKQNRNA